MLNFRQFEVGPDPFGRNWQVLFKWLQTAISLRHSDTVDVKFALQSADTLVQKQIAIPHADLPVSYTHLVLCFDSLNSAGRQLFGSRLLAWMQPFWAVRSMGGCLDAMMVLSLIHI